MFILEYSRAKFYIMSTSMQVYYGGYRDRGELLLSHNIMQHYTVIHMVSISSSLVSLIMVRDMPYLVVWLRYILILRKYKGMILPYSMMLRDFYA